MKKISIESAKIKDGQTIPVDFTGDGKDVSPPLAWKDM
ncbi:YbhB/YbcL family Raf kinase inhibitor-like protein, partial [Candidatus Sumerlaeota bacterium]|nr:YbhB/YbcL family Raf kinase inhibitor-like protein [Candidatus Sumerlaeota bacterium]